MKEINDVSIVRILIIEDDGTTSKFGNGNTLIGRSIDISLCDGLRTPNKREDHKTNNRNNMFHNFGSILQT
jgi:hypothetical protein